MGLGDPDCDGVCVTEALPELVPESDADSVWLGEAVGLVVTDCDGVMLSDGDTLKDCDGVLLSDGDCVWVSLGVAVTLRVPDTLGDELSLGESEELWVPVCEGDRDTVWLPDCDTLGVTDVLGDCVSLGVPVLDCVGDWLCVGVLLGEHASFLAFNWMPPKMSSLCTSAFDNSEST